MIGVSSVGGTVQDHHEKMWKPKDLVCSGNQNCFFWAGTLHSKREVVEKETGKVKRGQHVLRKGDE